MSIGSLDIVDETGATFRQLDWWVRHGVVPTLGLSSPGSGNQREFHENVLPRVKLLVSVSKAFSNRTSVETLRKIYNAYDVGFITLDDNIDLIVSWGK